MNLFEVFEDGWKENTMPEAKKQDEGVYIILFKDGDLDDLIFPDDDYPTSEK